MGQDLIPIAVRPLEDGDIGYVFETWAHSARGTYRDVGAREYMDGLRAHLQVLLGQRITALIAHSPDTPKVIVGWVIGTPPREVDYVYVRGEYRRSRVATRLLEAGQWDPAMLETDTRLGQIALTVARLHNVKIRARF